MGWISYSLYGGDDTQSCHYNFIKWSGLKISDDEIYENCMKAYKTKLPHWGIETFKNGIPKILKKMPKCKHWSESNAIEWQMLAALLVDNRIYHKEILKKGIAATEYLMGEHAADFNNPSARRQALKRFISRIKKLLNE